MNVHVSVHACFKVAAQVFKATQEHAAAPSRSGTDIYSSRGFNAGTGFGVTVQHVLQPTCLRAKDRCMLHQTAVVVVHLFEKRGEVDEWQL